MINDYNDCHWWKIQGSTTRWHQLSLQQLKQSGASGPSQSTSLFFIFLANAAEVPASLVAWARCDTAKVYMHVAYQTRVQPDLQGMTLTSLGLLLAKLQRPVGSVLPLPIKENLMISLRMVKLYSVNMPWSWRMLTWLVQCDGIPSLFLIFFHQSGIF